MNLKFEFTKKIYSDLISATFILTLSIQKLKCTSAIPTEEITLKHYFKGQSSSVKIAEKPSTSGENFK